MSENVIGLSAARAERAADARLWTPRDLLVDLLRRVDAGDLEAEKMVVVWWETAEPDGRRVRGDGAAGVDKIEMVTMLDLAHADAMDAWRGK